MQNLKRYTLLILLGIGAFFLTQQVEARAVSVWVGTWQSFDIPGDGSTNTLEITHGTSFNTYDLTWNETYFSACDGLPGYGIGQAFEDRAGLHVSLTIYCKGRSPQYFDVDFTYDAVSDTLSGASVIWERISPRPW